MVIVNRVVTVGDRCGVLLLCPCCPCSRCADCRPLSHSRRRMSPICITFPLCPFFQSFAFPSHRPSFPRSSMLACCYSLGHSTADGFSVIVLSVGASLSTTPLARPHSQIRTISRVVAMSITFPSKRDCEHLLEHLLSLDWVTRHEAMSAIQQTEDLVYLRLLTMMGPNEHRLGVDEARPPSDLPTVVVAQSCPGPRQLTIGESFERSWRCRS